MHSPSIQHIEILFVWNGLSSVPTPIAVRYYVCHCIAFIELNPAQDEVLAWYVDGTRARDVERDGIALLLLSALSARGRHVAQAETHFAALDGITAVSAMRWVDW